MKTVPHPPLSLCDPSDPYVASVKEAVRAIKDLIHERGDVEFAGIDRVKKGWGKYEIVIKFKDVNP